MNLRLIGRKDFHVYNEPILMKERRHEYIPQAFLWHGHCYRVHSVERCWTVLKRRQHKGRLCFLLRCAEGTFEVHQDLAANTWHLSRARWHEEENV
jgi:hypothetical protein